MYILIVSCIMKAMCNNCDTKTTVLRSMTGNREKKQCFSGYYLIEIIIWE